MLSSFLSIIHLLAIIKCRRYVSELTYYVGVGRFMATDIDPFLCTHVVYSFLGIKESSSRIYSRDPGLDFGPDEIEMDPDDELNYQGDLDMIRKTIQLRDGEEGNSTNLKILISVGGPNQSPSTFSIMAQNPGRRQQFVASAVEYMQQFNLDGLDLYWIYPSNETDKQNFVEVVKVSTDILSVKSCPIKQFSKLCHFVTKLFKVAQ